MSVTDYILRQVARTSTARPIFALCAYCGHIISVKAYGAANPSVSHGGHTACIEKEYPEYAAHLAAERSKDNA